MEGTISSASSRMKGTALATARGCPQGAEHPFVVHVVAEGHAFLRGDAERAADRPDGVSLVRVGRGDVAPMFAREGQFRPVQRGKHFHRVSARPLRVKDGNFAHGFGVDVIVEIFHFETVGVRLPRAGEKGFLVVFHVRVLRAAEDGEKPVFPPHGVQNPLDQPGERGSTNRVSPPLLTRAPFSQIKSSFSHTGRKSCLRLAYCRPLAGAKRMPRADSRSARGKFPRGAAPAGRAGCRPDRLR